MQHLPEFDGDDREGVGDYILRSVHEAALDAARAEGLRMAASLVEACCSWDAWYIDGSPLGPVQLADAIRALTPAEAEPADCERLDKLAWYASPDSGDWYGLPYSGLYHIQWTAAEQWVLTGPNHWSAFSHREEAVSVAEQHFKATRERGKK